MQCKLADGSVMVSGILPKDADYRTVGEKNSSFTTFGVKCGEKKIEGEEKPIAIWCNCKCWHEVAKAAKNFKKFDHVLCIGKIEINKSDDGKEYKNLVCEFVIKMPNAEAVQTQASTASNNIPEDFEELSDDGVPF
jgi:single-stranded DNA-binding protein